MKPFLRDVLTVLTIMIIVVFPMIMIAIVALSCSGCSSYVRPALAVHDVGDVSSANSELGRDLALNDASCGHCPNLQDVLVTQFRLRQFCPMQPTFDLLRSGSAYLYPAFTTSNEPHLSTPNKVSSSYATLTFSLETSGPDRNHILLGQSRDPSALGETVSRIVEVRPLEQVGRTDAGRVVATVQRTRHWPIAVLDEPRDAVRESCDALAADSKSAISVAFITTGNPNPARPKFRAVSRNRSVLVDLAPESCDRFLVHGNLSSCGPRARDAQTSPGALRG
jgi:hypothetical protein